jgi:hypothetical protein
MTYWQALSMFRNLKVSWPPEVIAIFNAFSVLNLNIEMTSPDCFMSDSKEAFELKFYATLAIPTLIALFCVFMLAMLSVLELFLSVIRKILPKKPPAKKPEETKLETPGENVITIKEVKPEPDVGQQGNRFTTTLSMFFLTLKMAYFSVAFKTLQLFACTYDGVNYYFEPEPNRYCFQKWWYACLPVAIVSLIVHVIGIPALFYWLYNYRAKILMIEQSKRTWYQRFHLCMTFKKNSEFKDKYNYWEIIIMFRKLLISGAQLFFATNIVFQVLMFVLIFEFALLYQNKHQPYAKNDINTLESTTLLCSIVVLFSGILSYVGGLNPVQTKGLSYAIIFTIFLSSGMILLEVYKQARTGINVAKELKKKEQEENLVKRERAATLKKEKQAQKEKEKADRIKLKTRGYSVRAKDSIDSLQGSMTVAEPGLGTSAASTK